MSHHSPEPPHTSSSEHESHHDAHVGLRLVLGSILAPKRPSMGSHSVSGTASPFHHFHQSGMGVGTCTGTGHETPPLPPPPPPQPTPVPPHFQSHYQPPYQHAHQPTPILHSHQIPHYHSHAQPQPQHHVHAHTFGPSRLSSTHSTPPGSTSPSPSPSPRLATPPLACDHASHAYPSEHAVDDSLVAKGASSTSSDAAADAKRAHFLKTLQSKSAWDAMIHGSFV
ncbi:hypothetical protein BGW80DRAFT_1343429 [Lactifluus volemus]|nr:hypothetical protein BGW80DRAFT_1343429 [Lactifluus volemus]